MSESGSESENGPTPMERLAEEAGGDQAPELSREELEKAAQQGAAVAEELGKLFLAFGGRMPMELYGSLLNHMSDEAGRGLRVRLLEAIGPVCDERLELENGAAFRVGLRGVRPGGAAAAHARLMGQMSDVADEIASVYLEGAGGGGEGPCGNAAILEMSQKFNAAGGGASGKSAVAMKYGERGVAAVEYYEALRNKLGAMLLFGRRACHRLVLEEPELMEAILAEANRAAAESGRPQLTVEGLIEIAVEQETMTVAISSLRDFERVGLVVERLP